MGVLLSGRRLHCDQIEIPRSASRGSEKLPRRDGSRLPSLSSFRISRRLTPAKSTKNASSVGSQTRRVFLRVVFPRSCFRVRVFFFRMKHEYIINGNIHDMPVATKLRVLPHVEHSVCARWSITVGTG